MVPLGPGGFLLHLSFTSFSLPTWDPLLATGAVLSQSYADDLHVYVHCLVGQAISAVETIGQAIKTLQAWMSSNRLHLNPTKTQFIWFGTRQQLTKTLGSLPLNTRTSPSRLLSVT